MKKWTKVEKHNPAFRWGLENNEEDKAPTNEAAEKYLQSINNCLLVKYRLNTETHETKSGYISKAVCKAVVLNLQHILPTEML